MNLTGSLGEVNGLTGAVIGIEAAGDTPGVSQIPGSAIARASKVLQIRPRPLLQAVLRLAVFRI